MKNTTFVIIVVIGIIALVVLVSSFGTGSDAVEETPHSLIKTPSIPPITPHVTPVPPETSPELPVPAYNPTNSQFPLKSNVNFFLDPGVPTDCGLTCRETTATITNVGNETAHNVCVWLNVRNEKGDIIPLNDMQTLYDCIGDLDGGVSKSEDMMLEADCGLFALNCAGQGLILSAKITSEEKTVVFPEQRFD